jgi:hypothetical protein
MGGVGAQRPVWRGIAHKKTGARSARARTRGQNPLVVNMLTETLLRTPLIVTGRCSPTLTPHWLQGKSAKIYLSQAAFGMILQDHRQLSVSTIMFKIAAVDSLKRISDRIFKISKYINQQKNFEYHQ